MRIILIAFILFSAGCNDRTESNRPLTQLQSVFTTANWQVVQGTDTSYIFFSPQMDNSFKTYQYSIYKGDSVNTTMGSIKEVNEKIEWDFFDNTLVLDNVRENETSWKDSTGANYILTRDNDSSLLLQTPYADLQFKKTLPLSTFLVRAKYDYAHRSNFVDSAEVKPRKSIGH